MAVLAVCCAKIAVARQKAAAKAGEPANRSENWSTFYGTERGWSYSPLDQISTKTVDRLGLAWTFDTGAGLGIESAPLIVDGVLYLVDRNNAVFALDAATGELRWKYIYKPKVANYKPRYPGRVRGLAFGNGHVFLGTNDNHVVSLNVGTGEEAWKVEIEDAIACGCTISSAPLFVKNKVITGITGGDAAHRGYLTAFDANTGKIVWRFYTIPKPGEPGSETWPGDSWKLGGGSTWYTGSYDPELNLIYWGTSNPSSDYYGNDRQGANLYTDCLVAIDADTGKLKWYFQETPHDVYDFDSNPEPILIDAAEKHEKRRLVLHSSKSGFAYVFDRKNGRLIRTFPYADSITWTRGLDKNGVPIDPVIPGRDPNFTFCPGGPGARNRNHSAYSPRTGLWYTTSYELCSEITPQKQDVQEGDEWIGGSRTTHLNPNHLPHIAAFDPLTGAKRWSFNTLYLNASSLLATGGDLVFAGDVMGNAFALNAKSGEKVWSFNTGFRLASPPVTFAAGGKQYVAMTVGGGTSIEIQVPLLWAETRGKLPGVASKVFVFTLNN